MAHFFDFLESVLMPVGVLWVIFYFTYMIIRTLAQRKERQMMVEKLASNPDMVMPSFENEMRRTTNPYGWIKPAGLLIGLGIGIFLCAFITPADNYGLDTAQSFMVLASLLVFGGLGMLGGFFLERSLRKSDENK